jgi:hypothetical protein
MAPGMVKPFELPELPAGVMNVTDPDSRVVRTQGQPGMQGYNAQLAVNDRQIIVAAEITTESPDFGHLEPIVRATQRELAALELGDPDIVLADAGYWHQRQMQQLASEGIPVLVSPDAGLRRGPRPGWTGGMYSFMRRVLETARGQELYRQRQITIEPVFGQIKFNRAIKRFQRRGRRPVAASGDSSPPATTSSSSTTTDAPPRQPDRGGRRPAADGARQAAAPVARTARRNTRQPRLVATAKLRRLGASAHCRTSRRLLHKGCVCPARLRRLRHAAELPCV